MRPSRLTVTSLLPLLGSLGIGCGDTIEGSSEPATGLMSPTATSDASPGPAGPISAGAMQPTSSTPTNPAAPVGSPASVQAEPDSSSETPAPAVAAEPEPEPVNAPEPEPAAPASEPEAAAPVDCSAIEQAGWELCESGPNSCAAVFTDGAGCAAVCAAAGLTCQEVWEDEAGSCSPDTALSALGCGTDTGHQSDYCVCGSAGGVAEPEPPPEPAPAVEPTPQAMPEPEPVAEPAPAVEPEPTAPVEEPEPQPEPEAAQPDVGPRVCECETPGSEFGTVDSTISVGPGQVYDGNCQIFRANPGTLGDGSQAEGQSPVFRVENGGTLRNVVLGASAADGIHTYGNVTLENVHWLDIGEDAMTIKESGTVTLDCGSATNSDDKIFQINAPSELHISNFTASRGGKFIRQTGESTFQVTVFIDHCDISDLSEVIFRTDSSSSHVTLTNTRYSGLGRGLFMFGSSVVNGDSGQSTVSNNQQY